MTGWPYQVFLMEIRKLFAYRADFWVNFFGQTLFSLVIAYYLWGSIFSYSGKEVLNGYDQHTMIFYYLVAPLIYRIQQGQGIGFASRDIYQGSLNKYLLYPLDFIRYKKSTYFANSTFFLFQLLFILCIYQIFFSRADIFEFNILSSIYFVISIYMATQIYFYLSLICELLAFWYDNIWSLSVTVRFLSSFLGGALIPLSFFPDWSHKILYYTPFPYLIDFPVRLLRNEVILVEDLFLKAFIAISWIFIFKGISLLLWNKGKYQYSGVGI